MSFRERSNHFKTKDVFINIKSFALINESVYFSELKLSVKNVLFSQIKRFNISQKISQNKCYQDITETKRSMNTLDRNDR